MSESSLSYPVAMLLVLSTGIAGKLELEEGKWKRAGLVVIEEMGLMAGWILLSRSFFRQGLRSFISAPVSSELLLMLAG